MMLTNKHAVQQGSAFHLKEEPVWSQRAGWILTNQPVQQTAEIFFSNCKIL